MKIWVSAVSFICICLLGAASVYGQSEEQPPPEIDGITKPASDMDLSFVQAGKISAIFVGEGDLVEPGDILMQQDDEIERIQLKILTARAGNMVPIEMAKTELEQKQKDLARIERAFEKGAVTQWEVDHAILSVDTSLLALKMREFDREQDELKLASIRSSINKLVLRSPAALRVEEIKIEVGEAVQALFPVIRLVQVDPLEINLPAPVAMAKQVSVADSATVVFGDGVKTSGRVVKISAVADAAATTLDIKIQVPNESGRPAGERIKVRLQNQNNVQQ